MAETHTPNTEHEEKEKSVEQKQTVEQLQFTPMGGCENSGTYPTEMLAGETKTIEFYCPIQILMSADGSSLGSFSISYTIQGSSLQKTISGEYRLAK